MAEGFTNTCGLGNDETTISPSNSTGVALATLQGLPEEFDATRDALAEKDDPLERKNEQLRERLAALEQRSTPLWQPPTIEHPLRH